MLSVYYEEYIYSFIFKDERNNFSMSIGEVRTNTELLVKRYLYQVENHCVIMNQKHRLLCLCLYISFPFFVVCFVFDKKSIYKNGHENLFHVNVIRRMKNKQTSEWLKE